MMKPKPNRSSVTPIAVAGKGKRPDWYVVCFVCIDLESVCVYAASLAASNPVTRRVSSSSIATPVHAPVLRAALPPDLATGML